VEKSPAQGSVHTWILQGGSASGNAEASAAAQAAVDAFAAEQAAPAWKNQHLRALLQWNLGQV